MLGFWGLGSFLFTSLANGQLATPA
jgi:hypothetical protein